MRGPFGWLRGRSARERDLDDEIRAHTEMAVRDRMARGESRAEAERAVRREFGNEARVKEVTRRMWGGLWWDRLRQDLRFGVRSLRRSPTFAVVAILTLGLGIGVTTAMFTVVNGVLLRSLPFSDPNRLVAVSIGQPPGPANTLVPVQDIAAVRDLSAFSFVGSYLNYPPVTLTGAGDAARLNAAFVSADFHRMLGVRPAIGSGFAPRDDAEGAAPTAVLGNALWQSRFGGDPAIVGRSITIDRVAYRVVGVMPAGFDFPVEADLWLPSTASPFTIDNYTLNTIARLADGVGIEQARTELAALATELYTPETPSGVQPLQDVLVSRARTPLVMFLGAVALVLLISCANVANLLLMRGHARVREVGLRKALGAAGPRVVRQLLTESVLLGLAGGVVGLLVATIGVRWLLSLAPPGTLPRASEIGVDRTVLGFVLGLSTGTGVLFGLAPAFWSARRSVAGIVGGSRTHTARRGMGRGLLVTVEVGLAVTLLVGAGLLIRSFQELRAVNLGFQPEQTLALEVDLPEAVYDDPIALFELHDRIVQGLRGIPGVTAAGATDIEPFGPVFRVSAVRIEDLPPSDTGYHARPVFSTATPGYLRSMGMTLLEGRDFTATDERGGARVALINRSMAERYWPGTSSIGRRFARNRNPGTDGWITIVGVVDDIVLEDVSLESDTRDAMFWIPMAQAEDVYILAHVEYVVRAVGGGEGIAAAMREVVRRVDPDVPSANIRSMDDAVLASMGARLFEMRILMVFALAALLLAGVGIFGVMAYTVNERLREIGIRMALGAEAGRVAGHTLGRVGFLVVPGLLIGAGAGVAASRVLSASLYNVTPLDLPTIVGVTLLLGSIAVLSAAIPARRASRVDPAHLLRSE